MFCESWYLQQEKFPHGVRTGGIKVTSNVSKRWFVRRSYVNLRSRDRWQSACLYRVWKNSCLLFVSFSDEIICIECYDIFSDSSVTVVTKPRSVWRRVIEARIQAGAEILAIYFIFKLARGGTKHSSDWSIKLTTHFHLVSMWRMAGAIPPSPNACF